LTMSPWRAIQLIRPHTAEHAGTREVLPRFGIALLGGFLAYTMLSPLVLPLLDLPAVAANHYVQAGSVSSDLVLWTLYGVVALLGGAGGWWLSPLINRLLSTFFRGFRRFFP